MCIYSIFFVNTSPYYGPLKIICNDMIIIYKLVLLLLVVGEMVHVHKTVNRKELYEVNGICSSVHMVISLSVHHRR